MARRSRRSRARELAPGEGAFFWNTLATRSAILAGALGALLFSSKTISNLTQGRLEGDTLGVVEGLGWPAAQVLALTIVGAILAGVAAALFQTKAVFGVSMLKASGRRKPVLSYAGLLPGFLLVGAITLGLAVMLVPDLIALAGGQLPRDLLAGQVAAILSRICKLLVVAAVVLAILLLFVTRLLSLVTSGGQKRRGEGGVTVSED